MIAKLMEILATLPNRQSPYEVLLIFGSVYSPKKFDFNTLKQLMGYGRLTEKKEAIHKV